jgi:tetratricopeptide (TPR) repeat protein
VAWKLQELQPDGSLQHAALIAEHLERAGDLVPAAAWHLQASVWFGTTSLSESLDRARRALSLLEGATATESQLQAQVPQRIEFAATQTILGFGQPMGISREEADAAFERGKAALAALSDVEPRELALLCFYYSSAAHVYTGAALELGEEAWALVERTGDPGARLVVGTARAGVLLEAGHLRTAYDHVRQLTEHLPEDVGEIKGYGGRSPLLSLLAYEGELVSRLGNPARGLLRLEEAFALAASSGDLARCSQVASAGARACFFMGDLPGAASWAERCVSIAKRTGTLAGALAANRSLRCAHVLARDWEELRRVAEQALEMEGPSSLRPRACLAHGLARLGSRKWVGALPIEIFEESLEQRPDLKDAALHCAWALIRGAGAAEQDRIEAALDGCEASMQHSEEPSRLPQVHAARAALARLLGDEAECQHEFDEVLRLAAEMGATGWVDWCAQELEELRLSRASPE